MGFTKVFQYGYIVLSFFVLFSGEAFSQQSEPMRIMSYNVRYNNTIDSINGWEFRRDNVAALVKYHKTNIFGLQESNLEQIKDMEERLEGFEWYGVPRTAGKNGEHTPIFYRSDRYTLLCSGTFWYSETPDVAESTGWDAMYPRIASWVKLKEIASDIEFFFFNTHFDHRGEIARQKSGEIIQSQIDSIAGSSPVILTGDFNTVESSIPYNNIVKDNYLLDAMHLSETLHYGPVNTSSGFEVRKKPISAKIDFIFVSDKVKVLEHATITDQQEGRYYSDHLPVIAEVILIK